MKTRIIAVANHKGGVSKTTTSASLGSILAMKGYKVLLIDLDPQANLTTSLMNVDSEESAQPTIYELMSGKVKDVPLVNINDNLDLIPSGLQLAAADIELSSAIARERILTDILAKDGFGEHYDFIILDCPPSLGIMTLNAFTASTDIIIPLVAEVLPFNGLKMIMNFINMVHSRLNPQAHVTGILIAKWEKCNLSKTIEEKMRERLGNMVFQTKIRKNVKLAEAPLENQNIVDYSAKSNGAVDYMAFTEEFLNRI